MQASKALGLFLDARPDSAGWALRVASKAGEHMPHAPQAELILYRVALHGVFAVLGEGILTEIVRVLSKLEDSREVEGRVLTEIFGRLDQAKKELGDE